MPIGRREQRCRAACRPVNARRQSAAWPAIIAAVVLAVATTSAARQPAGSAALASSELFDAQDIPRLDLRIHSQDWESLKRRYQENTYYPADFIFNGQTVRNIGIRSRGSGSRRESKPGLRVDFDRYVSDQRMLGVRSLVLDNLAQDPSGIRETTATRLFARLAVPASREIHARLYVNNEYAGLYVVVESIDRRFLARVFGTDDDERNDGYLYEYRWLAPWFFSYLGPDLHHYRERFEPRTHESASDAEKFDPIEQLVRLANVLPPEHFMTELDNHLDLESFVRFLAAQTFVADSDGFTGIYGVNNFYLYRHEDSTQHVLIAWDSDNAFSQTDLAIDTGHKENALVAKVMQVPSLRDLYFDVLEQAASIADERATPGSATGWLEDQIRQQLELIYPAIVEDQHRPYALDAHHRTYEPLIDFARERSRFVREQVARQR